MDTRQGNWIGGEPRGALRGATFDVAEEDAQARWPRSDARDLELALHALQATRGAWAPARRRRELLAAAARELLDAPDPGGRIASTLGLSPEDLDLHLGWFAEDLEAALERARASPPRRAGLALVRPHWSELFDGFAQRVFARLARGHRVLALADPVLPALGERIAAALHAAGVPGEAFALLHDDGETVLRAALEAGAFAAFEGAGHADPLARWARLASAAGLGGDDLALARVARSTVRIEAGEDPDEWADYVARESLGRAETLTGQLHGQIGAVQCHPRLLSRFTERLLAILEGGEAEFSPARPLEQDLPEVVERARDLGLDEGATLIHEGAERSDEHASPADERAARGRRSARGRRPLVPLVFTNVEPASRLARLLRPAPVLLLSRSVAGLENGARRG